MESKIMKELRKIRDENSLKRLAMTDEEIKKEEEEVIKWFLDATGKDKSMIVEATSSPKKTKEVVDYEIPATKMTFNEAEEKMEK